MNEALKIPQNDGEDEDYPNVPAGRLLQSADSRHAWSLQQVKHKVPPDTGHCCTMHLEEAGALMRPTLNARRRCEAIWETEVQGEATDRERPRAREKEDVVFVFLISPATTCVVRAVNGCQRRWGLDQWQGGSQSARVLQSVHMSVCRVALTRSGCVFVLCPCTVLDVFSNVDTGACERYAVPIWWANRHATRRISMWELVGLTLG